MTHLERTLPAGFAADIRRGMLVALVLAVLTIAEYFFATSVDEVTVRFIGLAITALAKTWLIVTVFMHFMRMFKTAEGH